MSKLGYVDLFIVEYLKLWLQRLVVNFNSKVVGFYG